MSHAPHSWYLITTVVMAVATIMQAAALCALAAVALKARKELMQMKSRMDREVMPFVNNTKAMIEEAAPKLKLVTDHLLDITSTTRLQVRHVNETVNDVVDRTHEQAKRVDQIVTGTLDSVAKATDSVQRAVGLSARQIVAVLTGIRVGYDVLRRRRRMSHSADDGENFI
jgi:methyl-accepting chemotaxis protein